MQQREVEIINKLGLNAPASTKLAQLAAKYQCDVSLMRNGRKVNAKSLMGVMMLAAGKGSHVVLETDGPDEGSVNLSWIARETPSTAQARWQSSHVTDQIEACRPTSTLHSANRRRMISR